MTYTDTSLGNVAATRLRPDDLTVFWNATLGSPLQSQPVIEFISLNLPPVADIMVPLLPIRTPIL